MIIRKNETDLEYGGPLKRNRKLALDFKINFTQLNNESIKSPCVCLTSSKVSQYSNAVLARFVAADSCLSHYFNFLAFLQIVSNGEKIP